MKLKLAPSLRLKEKLISLSDSVEQNAKHSLSKDLLSLGSLMELMELAIVCVCVCELLFSPAERCFSAPASSAVTQQLLGAGHLGGGDPPQAQGAVGGGEEGKLKGRKSRLEGRWTSVGSG